MIGDDEGESEVLHAVAVDIGDLLYRVTRIEGILNNKFPGVLELADQALTRYLIALHGRQRADDDPPTLFTGDLL